MIYRLFKNKPKIFSVEIYSAGNLVIWAICLFTINQFNFSRVYDPMAHLAGEKIWAIFFMTLAGAGVYLLLKGSRYSNTVFASAYLCLAILFTIGNPYGVGGYIYSFYTIFHFAKWRIESFYQPISQ